MLAQVAVHCFRLGGGGEKELSLNVQGLILGLTVRLIRENEKLKAAAVFAYLQRELQTFVSASEHTERSSVICTVTKVSSLSGILYSGFATAEMCICGNR